MPDGSCWQPGELQELLRLRPKDAGFEQIGRTDPTICHVILVRQERFFEIGSPVNCGEESIRGRSCPGLRVRETSETSDTVDDLFLQFLSAKQSNCPCWIGS